ncbi:hypothetical protein [Nocardioides acrostichi]|uniref:Uncharacterized protein n=1 Tax=Nocardioides acrostichi TaxID=2784339 RepID=A0A930YEJ5_9ACTN|nr:hypothetical protein [Nocardioides acrostichi]MBF4163539.1 hypothetical protein [Nocardioides acrostichi]
MSNRTPATRHLTQVPPTIARAEESLDPRQDQRRALRLRHSSQISSLMSQRDDLRGVSALADIVVDAVRWTA